MASHLNPLAFRTWPVTVILCAALIALFSGSLYLHHVVPSAPSQKEPVDGIDLAQAWTDLQMLSEGFHPYNSHGNDNARRWILERIRNILEDVHTDYELLEQAQVSEKRAIEDIRKDVVIYDDFVSNITFAGNKATSVYFEGGNIIVYVKGSSEIQTDTAGVGQLARRPRLKDNKCVLVNSHFDSVSTGFGATDDGVGVITLLQLLSHYTTPANKPQKCLVLLFNNGEEDYLNGARAFGQHPLSSHISTFMNLEGAGAGGRASMFRSTDAEIASAYQRSPHPFGTALSADGFRQGLIRSQTDYLVFEENLGYRGVDVAFIEPRSRYHTFQDSTKETSIDSVWHMLSAALATTHSMLNHDSYGSQQGKGSEPVYFDLFGRALGIIGLNTFINISIAVLVVGAFLLILITVLIVRQDKFYFLAGKAHSDALDPHTPDEQVTIDFQGRRGFFRAPITFVLAIAATVGVALLQAKVNPSIVYSSPYAAWSMILSAFVVIAWFCLSAADRTRPTALQRLATLAWLYTVSWLLLVFLTVIEVRNRICGAYIGLFLNAASCVALIAAELELLNLPKKSEHVRSASQVTDSPPHTPTASSRPLSRRGHEEPAHDPDESSPLLGGDHSRRHIGSQSQFSRFFSNTTTASSDTHAEYNEQPWSKHLLTSLWPLQLLVLLFPILLTIQIGLFLTSALAQTLGDGSNPLTIYAAIAALSCLILLPTTPFLHRLSPRVPLFLLLVFAGTLIYNLTAFPFSRDNRLKMYFQQRVDLSNPLTANVVSLTGLDGYVQTIASEIPSTRGQRLNCTGPGKGAIPGLTTCTYSTTLLPHVLHPNPNTLSNPHTPHTSSRSIPISTASKQSWNSTTPPSHDPNPSSWLTFKTHRLNTTTPPSSSHEAVLKIRGTNTRACKILFNQPLSDFNVTGSSAEDTRFGKIPAEGVRSLRLFSRSWGREFEVRVRWEDLDDPGAGDGVMSDVDGGGVWTQGGEMGELKRRQKERGNGLSGQAICLWSDANDPATIPALTEVMHYIPNWSAVTKLSDGLVEGYRDFEIA